MFKEKTKVEELMFLDAINRVKLYLYMIVDFCHSYKKDKRNTATIEELECILEIEEFEYEFENAKNDFCAIASKLIKKKIAISDKLIEGIRLVHPSNFDSTKQVARFFKEIDEKNPFRK